MTHPWDYQVTDCRRVVDGDTYDLTLCRELDFGFYLIDRKTWTARFRLLDLDTPETNQAGGGGATQAAATWIGNALNADTLRGQTHKTDNFGRWLIDLYRADTGEHLADALRAGGWEKVH